MSASILSCLWCVMQVTLLSAIGVAISRCTYRRNPDVGAQVASAAATTILAITVLLPIPLPRLFVSQATLLPQVTERAAVARDESSTSAVTTREFTGQLDSSQSAPVLFDARILLSALSDLTPDRIGSSQTGNYVLLGLATVAAGFVAWGVCGFFSALRYIARLRQHSAPIMDRDANRMLSQLVEKLSIRKPVMLRESQEVASATVVGWRKPVIVLPLDWEFWTNDQRLAALAHELAHVRRGDFLWRLLSTMARAMHFYHPLIHWLVHQLTLSQELAADRLAAATIGNQNKYLKALSQLAIRQDDLSRLRSEPIVLPALSTHLIRRIKMLRAKDCSHDRQLPLSLRRLATGMIVIVGVTTMVLRSSVEPFGSIANAEPIEHTPQAATAEQLGETALFNREPIDISLIGDNETGAFAVRLGELARDPEYRPVLMALNEMFRFTWQVDTKLGPAPEFHFETVDQVIGTYQFEIRSYDPPGDGDQRNFVRFRAPEVVIRFHGDVQLRPWIRKHLPSAQEKFTGDLTYFEYDEPKLGPPILIAALDRRTVILSRSLEKLQKMADKTAEHHTSPTLATEWKATDGGLLTVLTTGGAINPAEPISNHPVEIATYKILREHMRKLSLGIDLRPELSEIAMKWNVVCENQKSAELVREATDKAISYVLPEVNKELNSLEPGAVGKFTDIWNRFVMQHFKNSSSNVVQRDDGTWAVEIQSVVEYPLREMATIFAMELNDELKTR